MSLLKELREKPDNVKKQIAFISAAVLTGVIVVTWFAFKDFSVTEIERGDAGPLIGVKDFFATQVDALSADVRALLDRSQFENTNQHE